ncbi:S41 family peptidase [Pedobacter gandavensis]|uniref:S41 family peptidase n=1 Tax=Pedobacter gandavensis TaxID=2679963 RepID=UPI00292CB949|nr:S41 family peptidase [Pedobacter gandavensis]
MSKMKDGHLYGSLPAQLETYRNEKALFFPVKLQFIAHKVYADTVPNPLIPAGSEIISINNKPILAIQIELLKYLVSDGNIQTKKYRILNNFFYFYYFIAFAEQPYFDVVYKSRDGQIKKDRIKADLEKNIIANEKPDSPQPPIDFSIKPGHIALITIRTFDPQALKVDFKEFLTTSFKQVLDLNIKTIIIDLRGNGGGKDTYGSLLYTYLANKPFKYYKNLKTVTKNLEYEKFKTNVSSYNDLKPSMIKEVGGHQYQMDKEAHPNLQLIPPNKYHYDGKVLFLIDGSSFSTASEFCAIAYSHKRGDFIGEETGGTYDGNTSGVQTEFILPNTKMEISFGPVKYEMSVNPVKEIGRGVIPQHKIYPNIQDIIENKDVQLKYAIWLAGQ